MDFYRIYTRKTLGIDNRIWRSMIAISLIAIGLMSYRLMGKEKCTLWFKINTSKLHSNNVFYVGESLSFIPESSEKNIAWTFGDNTGYMGATAEHAFLTPGEFEVKADNFSCHFTQKITIIPALKVDTLPDNTGIITGPNSGFSPASLTFTYEGPPAKFYEWSVLNHPEFVSKSDNEPKITYIFKSSGPYTVQVKLDHDLTKKALFGVRVVERENTAGGLIKNITELITINQKENNAAEPIPEEPVEKKADSVVIVPPPHEDDKIEKKALGDEAFRDKLQQLANNEKIVVADFNDYLCENENTKVIVNGKENRPITFQKLCEELKKKRKNFGIFKDKTNVKSVILNRFGGKCAGLIRVNYD